MSEKFIPTPTPITMNSLFYQRESIGMEIFGVSLNNSARFITAAMNLNKPHKLRRTTKGGGGTNFSELNAVKTIMVVSSSSLGSELHLHLETVI